MGQITASIQSGTGYKVSTILPSSVVVNFVDNDEIPTISILTQAESVFEGEKIVVPITTSNPSSSELIVQLSTQNTNSAGAEIA